MEVFVVGGVQNGFGLGHDSRDFVDHFEVVHVVEVASDFGSEKVVIEFVGGGSSGGGDFGVEFFGVVFVSLGGVVVEFRTGVAKDGG